MALQGLLVRKGKKTDSTLVWLDVQMLTVDMANTGIPVPKSLATRLAKEPLLGHVNTTSVR
jgi:hypothetical protein